MTECSLLVFALLDIFTRKSMRLKYRLWGGGTLNLLLRKAGVTNRRRPSFNRIFVSPAGERCA
jgi:hypothetical protein